MSTALARWAWGPEFQPPGSTWSWIWWYSSLISVHCGLMEALRLDPGIYSMNNRREDLVCKAILWSPHVHPCARHNNALLWLGIITIISFYYCCCCHRCCCYSTWYILCSTWNQELQLENCIHQIGLWSCLWECHVRQFPWLMVDIGGPSPWWAMPSLGRWAEFYNRNLRK